MKKLLSILCMLLMLMPVTALAEDVCPLCGGTSDQCLTDEVGAMYCSGTLVSYPEGRAASYYAVREGTVMIGEGAFRDCTNLEIINFPDSLLIIADEAFYGCTALRYVNGQELPPNLYALGSWAFAGCSNLYELDVNAAVRFIGDGAFAASGLTDLYLYSTQFVYGMNVIPEKRVTIHMPGEYPSAVISGFVADHAGTVLRFDLAEEDW